MRRKRFELLNVLHLTHPWRGGISTYIADLKQASGEVHKIYTMKSWEGVVSITYDVAGKTIEKEYLLDGDLKLQDFTNERYFWLLANILKEYDIDIVHIDSHVGHTFDIFVVPTLKNIPIVCMVHDFFYICPTFHLVDRKGDYCNICNMGEENHLCLENHDYLYSKFNGDDLIEFREKFRSLIRNVDLFVFPSNSTREIFSKYYSLNESICRVIYHGSSLIKKEAALPVRGNRDLRVGILGSMMKHKGKVSVEAIMSSLEGHPIDFYHFGDIDLSASNLTNLGRYDQGNILNLLHSKQIDVILLLSTWPETFSYTLSESILANIPPIVTNMGALAERVSANKIGWLVDYKDTAGISDLILKLSKDDSEVEKYKQRICKVKLKSLFEMIHEYDELYNHLLTKSFILDDFVRYVHWKSINIMLFFYRVKSKVYRLIYKSKF